MPANRLAAVFDSSTLVSAFLNRGGVSYELLRFANDDAFQLVLSEDILAETARVLLESPHIRQRYRYQNERVIQYITGLRILAHIQTDFPQLQNVVRDPNDDMIVACAVGSDADYIVARDKDLLDLGTYEGITLVSPEVFISLMRERM